MLVFLKISMMIVFPKLEPPCHLRWFVVPLPSYRKNPSHPESQMESWRRHISTLPLTFQLFRSNIFCGGIDLLTSDMLLAHRLRFQQILLLLVVVSQSKKNSSCSAGGHFLQDLNHLFLDCLASEPLCKSIFDSAVCTQACGSTIGSILLLPILLLHPSKGIG